MEWEENKGKIVEKGKERNYEVRLGGGGLSPPLSGH